MPSTDSGKSYISPGLYDTLKAILTIAFPAFSALYLGLAELWDLPGAQQVVGTCALLATFLGVILMISSGRYKSDNQGSMTIMTNADGTVQPKLALNKTPEELAAMDHVHFKVVNTPPPSLD